MADLQYIICCCSCCNRNVLGRGQVCDSLGRKYYLTRLSYTGNFPPCLQSFQRSWYEACTYIQFFFTDLCLGTHSVNEKVGSTAMVYFVCKAISIVVQDFEKRKLNLFIRSQNYLSNLQTRTCQKQPVNKVAAKSCRLVVLHQHRRK